MYNLMLDITDYLITSLIIVNTYNVLSDKRFTKIKSILLILWHRHLIPLMLLRSRYFLPAVFYC